MEKEFLIYELPKNTENIKYEYVSEKDDYKQNNKIKMTEKPTAQECEQLRKEVKESKKELLYTLKHIVLIACTIVFIDYISKDAWTLKDVFLYSFMVYLADKKFPFKSIKK